MAVTHASVTQGDESAEGTFASALIEHLHLALKYRLLEQNGLSRLQKATQLQNMPHPSPLSNAGCCESSETALLVSGELGERGQCLQTQMSQPMS